MNIENMTMAELIEAFNSLTGASVKRFSDRATGVARLKAALVNSKKVETVAQEEQEVASSNVPVAANEKETMKAEKKDRSKSIAASWNSPHVYEKRLMRHTVKVNGVEFNSVLMAFHYHNLPVGRHIRFRMNLKKSGKETFEFNGKKYVFEINERY